MSNYLYISGLNGSSTTGLGLYLKNNYSFDIIALNDEFNSLSFEQKTNVICEGLKNKTHVIATSFGAYLFLNSVTEQNKELKVLLFSPVLGITKIKNGGRIPQNLSNFRKRIKANELPIPNDLKIVSGDSDDICPVENIEFIQLYYPNIEISILKGQGHSLDKVNVQQEIEHFLES